MSRRMVIERCTNCRSLDTSWSVEKRVGSGAPVDGRLRVSEVQVVLVLGCNRCSETVEVVDPDTVTISRVVRDE